MVYTNTDLNLNRLVINKIPSKAIFDNITKNPQELYLVEGDDAYIMSINAPSTINTQAGACNIYTVIYSDNHTESLSIYNGTQGPQGIQGEQGQQGIKGDQGEKGEKGDQGIQGETGSTGDSGVDGSMIYVTTTNVLTTSTINLKQKEGDLCLNANNGNVYRYEYNDTNNRYEWSFYGSIKGADGADGEKGDQGDQGVPGPQGLQGIQGEKGEKGDQGDQGVQGPIGPQGQQGPRGYSGTAGSKWFSGVSVRTNDQVEANSSSLYNVGDYYLNTQTGNVYKLETYAAGLKWTYQANIKGPQGETGQRGNTGDRGNTIFAGTLLQNYCICTDDGGVGNATLVPVANIGDVKIDDLYHDNNVHWLFKCTAIQYDDDGNPTTSTWVPQARTIGADGEPGEPGNDGEDGDEGRRGAMWYSGGEPDEVLYTDILAGDYFLVTVDVGFGAVGDVYRFNFDGQNGDYDTDLTHVGNIRGEAGTSITVKADAASCTRDGDGYINSDGDLIIKVGSDWQNAGQIRGPQGLQGPRGLQGVQGDRGSIWYTGSAVTGTTTSNANVANSLVNDFYLHTTTYNVYKKTSDTTWTFIGNIKGLKGDTGTPGTNGTNGQNGTSSMWYAGTSYASLDPNKGDMFLDTNNGNVYQYDTSWTYVCNIKGDSPSIDDVAQIVTNTLVHDDNFLESVKGDTGSQWYLQESCEVGDTNDGDVWLDTTTYDVWQNVNGAWVSKGNIKGPQGPAGTSGSGSSTTVAGTTWYYGTSMTGASSSVQITNAKNDDMYLNNSTGEIYKCRISSNTQTWTRIYVPSSTTYTGTSPISVSGSTISHLKPNDNTGVVYSTLAQESLRPGGLIETFSCESEFDDFGHLVNRYQRYYQLPKYTLETNLINLQSGVSIDYTSDDPSYKFYNINNTSTSTVSLTINTNKSELQYLTIFNSSPASSKLDDGSRKIQLIYKYNNTTIQNVIGCDSVPLTTTTPTITIPTGSGITIEFLANSNIFIIQDYKTMKKIATQTNGWLAR